MTADRDPTRIVRSWLRTDEHENADRVLETVLRRLDTTPQRRHLWPSRRFPRMINFSRIAIGAAAAVVVVGVLGYNVLPQLGGTRIAGPATPAPTATLAPTLTPAPSSEIARLDGQEQLDGRYAVGGGIQSLVTVAVPAGWSAGGDWVVVGPKDNDTPDGMAVRFYEVGNLVKNPAAPSDGVLDPAIGPRVADLVDAIVSHPAWTASEPSDITLDGHPGQLVRLTIPDDAEFDSEGNFYLFQDQWGGRVWGFSPGQIFDLHIVDVAGERIVIDAFHYPGTTAGDLAIQQEVVNSVELGARP